MDDILKTLETYRVGKVVEIRGMRVHNDDDIAIVMGLLCKGQVDKISRSNGEVIFQINN
jgi:hypothetical protein